MSSLPPDPYKILGVSKDAQIPEIRSAHRKLVLKCHPDKVQDPTLKAQKQDEFQKVQQAYELLSNDKERQKYDDQVKLAELRKQMQNRANTAAPRSSPKYAGEYEIRTEPRPSSYKATTSSSPPNPKVYANYSRSWEDDSRRPDIFDAHYRPSRQNSYSAEKPSKRDSDRERERDRDREQREREREYREAREVREREKERDAREVREREKERDRELLRERERELRERERRKKKEAEEAARREKESKEARRAEKKRAEKQRDKEIKRESEEKKKYSKPYIESYEDEVPVSSKSSSDKKKSSSRKHDEKRERSSHREEPIVAPAPPMPDVRYDTHLDFAASYIEASRSKVPGGLQRSATYHMRTQPPAVPTPPPAPGQASPFPTPDEEDVHRSSAARVRRGSSDTIGSTRSRSHKKASRETLDDRVPVMEASPSTRHTPAFTKSATTTPVMSTSPPRHDLPRSGTMPIDTAYAHAHARPIPPMARAQTFSYGEGSSPRGRSRSRLQPQQIDEEYESEEEYEPPARERKHRSSKKNRSPEHETVRRYQVDGGRAKAYTRNLEPEMESYAYYPATSGVRVVENRPSMPPRESSYTHSGGSAKYAKIKQSKAYGEGDIQFSEYYQQPAYQAEYQQAYA